MHMILIGEKQMRRRNRETTLLLLIFSLAFAKSAVAAVTNLYVSPVGSDSWSGTLAATSCVCLGLFGFELGLFSYFHQVSYFHNPL